LSSTSNGCLLLVRQYGLPFSPILLSDKLNQVASLKNIECILFLLIIIMMDDNHNDFVGVMPQLGALPTNCPDPDPDGITVKR